MTLDEIAHYADGGQRLDHVVRGLTPADMAVASEPGLWSIQHLVVHVADAEAAFADRAKRIIAMDEPVLLAWDEGRFSAGLQYDRQSVADAVALVNLTRRQLARVLQHLPAAAFDRAGVHNQRGRQTLTDVIRFADRHLDHHLTFVNGKRERMGKLMG